MRNLLLVRYGEIFLKGQNRPLFMRALVKRIKYAVKDLSATVLLHDGRILVSDFDDLDECIRRVTKVFGVHSVCPAVEMPKDDFDALCNQAVAMMADLSGTFRVTARRSDKNYFMDSPAINIEMGHRILTANKNLSVDVKKPLHTMNVEIRDMAYLYVKVIPAVGGMPVGTNGRATLLLSGGDVETEARAWAAAGSDARMNGCEMSVVICSGSGNQGMTASLPVIEYAKDRGASREELLRALAVADLITIHQKTSIGRLSAFCGAVSAGSGAAAGIAYLEGGRYEVIAHTIANALAICSGMICDGAKPSCAAKIASAVEAGLLGWKMQQHHSQFYGGDGIVVKGVENTIRNVGTLASEGMRETDRTIIRLMTSGMC